MEDNLQHEKELCGELVPRLFDSDVWADIDKLSVEDTILVLRQAQDVVRKGLFDDSTHHYLTVEDDNWGYVLCHSVYEDTVYGRLYVDTHGWENEPYRGIMVCDMSLSEGDTFVLEDNGIFPSTYWGYDTIGDRSMIVDSVRYIDGRKNIFLSLIAFSAQITPGSCQITISPSGL